MPHSSPTSLSSSKRRGANAVPVSTRLLPLPDEVIGELLIEYHMTLANLRRGAGDFRHFATMARVVVLTCHLFQAGYGEAQVDGLMEVQDALDRSHRKAVDTGIWGVDEAAFELLADLLVLHEEQLRAAPLNVVAKWNDKVEQAGKASAARNPSMRTAA